MKESISEIDKQIAKLQEERNKIKKVETYALLKEYEGKYIFLDDEVYYKLMKVDNSGARITAYGVLVNVDWDIDNGFFSGRLCDSPFFRDNLALYEIEDALIITKEEFEKVVNTQLYDIKSRFLSEE